MSLREKLISSGLFDSSFYSSTYEDVKESIFTPLEHYLEVGLSLNRSPSKAFCSKSYSNYHQDVRISGMPALEHYLSFGIQEGRQTFLYLEDVDDDLFSNYCEGNIESLHDGKVLSSRSFYIKGWVDSFHSDIKGISCVADGKEVFISSEIIRRDISSNKVINGFNYLYSAPRGVVSLTLELSVVFQTGMKIFWEKFDLWFNDFSDSDYKTSIINLEFIRGKEQNFLQLINRKENYVAISVSDEKVVEISGSNTIKLGKTSTYHVYTDHTLEHHVASFPILEENNNQRFVINNNEKLIRSYFFEVAGIDKSHSIYVNGKNISVEMKNGRLGLDVSKFSFGNNKLVVEIFCSGEHLFTTELFLYVPDREVPVNFSFVSERGINLKNNVNRNFILLRRGDSPTDQLYIEPFLSKISSDKEVDLKILNSNDFDKEELELLLLESVKEGSDIIVTRYIEPAWLEVLLKLKSKFRSIIYLMDDDVLSAYQTPNLPENYRKRMRNVALQDWAIMSNLCDYYINTSTKLINKYRGSKCISMHPSFFGKNSGLKADLDNEITISYHATGGHKNDIDFIASAISKIVSKYPFVTFKIVLGGYCPPLLKDNPQVQIYSNMSWSEYQKFIEFERSDIGLAPLLKSPYNESKSIVKLVDIAKLGAVGIFSECESYSEHIINGENGFLLPNEATAWYKTMNFLIENPNELKKLKKSSVLHAETLLCPNKNLDKWLDILSLNKD